MVNFGFWIGSLWGDHLLFIRSLLRGDSSISTDSFANSQMIPPLAFVVGWRLCCSAPAPGPFGRTGDGQSMSPRCSGLFHFYTQWFERLRLER